MSLTDKLLARCTNEVIKKHGGQRKGAGRKPHPVPKRIYAFRLTQAEYEHLLSILLNLRNSK